MKITLEISMYPLRANYEEAILGFIKHLSRKDALKVKVNALSTQVQGEWDEVFAAVKAGAEAFFGGDGRGSFVMKVLPGNIDLEYRHTEG